MNHDLKTLIAAKDAAVAAVLPLREKLMASYGKVENSYKQDTSVVTELDMWAEHQIKDALRSFDDKIGFLGEEHGVEGSETLRWVIDPIDGTEQFIRGIPVCSNMITLVDGKDLLMTVVYNFVTDELYWAVKGGGAWLGNQRLAISERSLKRSFIEGGIDVTNDAHLEMWKDIYLNVKAVIRNYASGYVGCMIAAGRTEARLIISGKGGPWDYAPGALLITEAGGVAMHLDGSPYDYMNTDNLVYGTKEAVDYIRSLQK